MDIERSQSRTLKQLLSTAARTRFGTTYSFSAIASAEEYAATVPLSSYSHIENDIQEIKAGGADILWPGKINRFAVSSGTTGKGKHLPISDERLQSDLKFMKRVSRHILLTNPNPKLITGCHAALSGSVEHIDGCEIGEISGLLAAATPWWMSRRHKLCPREAVSLSWKSRYEKLVETNAFSDLRVISGVPSWLLLFFRDVSALRGKPLDEVWPNLRLVVTGGVALNGYSPALHKLLGSLPVHFLENYGASEGYYAFGWENEGNLQLQINNGIYYEFIPHIAGRELVNSSRSSKTEAMHSWYDVNPIPLHNIDTGVPYNMIVTNNSGLWRYLTNDIITFDSKESLRIRVTGRANEMTDQFGEALYATEARQAFENIWSDHNMPVRYHIKPEWDASNGLPIHTWIIFQDDSKMDLYRKKDIEKKLDEEIQRVNRHYAIRRETNALQQLRIHFSDEFSHLEHKQKTSAQSKIGLFI